MPAAGNIRQARFAEDAGRARIPALFLPEVQIHVCARYQTGDIDMPKLPTRYTLKRYKGGWILVYTMDGELARVPCFTIEAALDRIQEAENMILSSAQKEAK